MPNAFISAVFSLESECEAVINIIEVETAWQTVTGRHIIGSALDGSYNLIEESDLYIGIFKEKSGSLVASSYTFITELEYYRALNLGKPMLIYVVDQRGKSRDKSLELFLETINNDLESGVCIRRCKNTNELINAVKRDLDEIIKRFDNSQRKCTVPSVLLKNAIRKIASFGPEVLSHKFIYLSSSYKQFDLNFVKTRLNLMEEHFSFEQYHQAVEVGTGLIEIFLSSGKIYKDEEITRLWAALLKMWSASCTWMNYIDGQFGALQASLLRREAYRFLGDWLNFYESHALIANCYYLEASTWQIKKSYADSLNEIREYEAARQTSLARALIYAEIYRTRIKQPFPHIYRAYINRELGNFPAAIVDFKRMVKYKNFSNERNQLDYSINLGYALILHGKSENDRSAAKEGLFFIEDSEKELERFNKSPHYISFMKKVAQSYVIVGDKDKGRELFDRLFELASERKLIHQGETINILQNKLNI